jgi:transglutaminase-like putative cysteine protease
MRIPDLLKGLAAATGLLLILGSPSFAAEYRLAPIPAWVIPVSAGKAAPQSPTGRRGEQVLLSDHQVRVDQSGRTNFVHYIGKPLSTAGVEEISSFSATFDPSYQSLTLHSISVTRDGKSVDRLKTSSKRVMQRETGIEERTFDGRKTVNVSLEDVRVGDIVEFSYSIAGSNPVFNSLSAGRLDLQWGIPIGRKYTRLMFPKERKIDVSMSKSAAPAQIRELGTYQEYVFDQHNVQALPIDHDAPEDFDPRAHVEWSEFANWQAVAIWAAPMYRVPANPGPSVNREIEQIRQSHEDQAARVAAVLHFVQREIRYLGVQVGVGTHRPNLPSTILQRRYGDCKDKALLTVTMLRAMGIEALPALVNTDISGAVKLAKPSPHAFNHVLVKVILDGKVYWIDPTRTLQPSGLDLLHQPDYGLALVIDPGTTDLEAMLAKRRYNERVHATYNARAGVGKAVTYTVKTQLLGLPAENLRNRLAAQGIGEVEEDYLNFYAKRFPAIQRAAAMEIKDDVKENKVEVIEKYTLPDFWTYSAEKRRQTGTIRSAGLRSSLGQPEKLIRSSPLAVEHPRDLEEVTEVLLPEAWDLVFSSLEVKDAAFRFWHFGKVEEEGHKLVFTDIYKTQSDRVPQERVAEYAKNLKLAYDSVGYNLYKNDKKTPSWVGAGGGWRTALIVAAVLWLLLVAVRRFLPHPASQDITAEKVSSREETSV